MEFFVYTYFGNRRIHKATCVGLSSLEFALRRCLSYRRGHLYQDVHVSCPLLSADLSCETDVDRFLDYLYETQ